MTVIYETVTDVTTELVDALNRLIPQLSANAEPLTSESLREIVTSDASTLFVARSDGAIVGSLTLVIFPIPSGRRAWIEDVVVDESARGLGIGRGLTRAAIDHAMQHRITTIDLTSRPSRTAANSLYQDMGFSLRQTNVYRYFVEE
jgi:ribosomal protein S18 acetylase RimI-like enzyme